MSEEPDRPDTEAIMAEVRARIAARAAEGASAVDGLFAPVGDGPAFAQERLEAAEDLAKVAPEPTHHISTRKVIGPVITRARGFVVRANTPSAADLADQQTRFNTSVLGYLHAIGGEVERLRSQGVAQDRLDRIEERLARLERALGAASASGAGADSAK